jgi:hypothetical protein
MEELTMEVVLEMEKGNLAEVRWGRCILTAVALLVVMVAGWSFYLGGVEGVKAVFSSVIF